MSAFLHQAVLATREIINVLQQNEHSLYALHNVGAGGDVSIGADLLSERIYAEHLLPLASIDSEESGFLQGNGSDTIVLDPLDGSDNFLSHIPYYGSSLALYDASGEVKEAVIFNFCTKEAFARIRTDENTIAIHVHIESYLDEIQAKLHKNLSFIESRGSVIANAHDIKAFRLLQSTSVSKCGLFEKAYCNPKIAESLYEKRLKFRSLGASALSMAKAYEVNFMLFVGKIRDFDSKAGLFLCEPLHCISTDKFTLISKDKHIFDTISHIFMEHKG